MSKRILAIDDDRDFLKLIKTLLEPEGYELEFAMSGRQGLQKALANPPDLVLIDVMMPELNGPETVKKMKADSRTDKIPVIMITALDKKEYVKAALFKLGVQYYIVKPFDPEELTEKVRDAIKYAVPRD